MLRSKKRVFWEALIVTVFIFLIGFLFGIYMERGNYNRISDYSTISEINLLDGMILIQLSENRETNCEFLKKENINFANRIYEEARLLEKYEESGKITESMKILHRKYNMLRTLSWVSNSNALEMCGNYDLVVYLYEYESEDLNVKATQSVWSRKLSDIKKKNEDMVLLPIAVNQELSSLNILLEKYSIEGLPAVIVNNNEVLYNVDNFNIN